MMTEDTIDQLTGLTNINGLGHDIVELAGGCMIDEYVGVVLLDIDDFKTINDLYGPVGGDTVLVELAKRLRDSVGPDGEVARIGADIFVVLVPGARVWADVTQLGERVLPKLATPIEYHDEEISVQIKIGITRALAGSGIWERIQDAQVLAAQAKSSPGVAAGPVYH